MPFDKITLNSGQSLIIAHCPESLDLKKVGAKQQLEKKSVESFGLFDSATPNFQTYYPGVTAEDLKPTADQFIRPVFRLLSETIVHRKHNPIDFAKNKVLKASMPKLLGQSLYGNHEALVGNELGSVAKVSWEESYTASNGLIVPAGINGELLIDGKSHPQIARGILMDPPSIHSNSVTVSFEWEQSHPKLERSEFMSKIGSFGSDGELIRRIVSEIHAYHETSLVAHGADPFAQLIRDGEINNPVYIKAAEQLSAKTGTQHYFFSYKTDTTSLSEEEQTHDKSKETLTDPTMEKILISLAAFFGITALTEAEAQTKLAELNGKKFGDLLKAESDLAAEKLKVTTLEGEKTTLSTELEAKKTEVTSLTVFKTAAETALSAKRTDVTRMYNILFKDKIDATMLSSILTADDAILSSLQTQYQTLMDKQYPGKCNDCSSTNVTRNTAIIEDPNEKKPENQGNGASLEKPKTNAEVMAEFNKKPSIAGMHGIGDKK